VLPHIVWACLDPDYYSKDRQKLLDAFLRAKGVPKLQKIMEDEDNIYDCAQSAHEILQMHKTFSREWIRKHYKYLTPYITSACTMLIEKCKNAIPYQKIMNKYSPLVVARIIWRNQRLRTLMLDALYWQITNLENTKGGRNPSYKQMSSTTSSYTQAYYAFYRQPQGFSWGSIDVNQQEPYCLMTPLVIDWYKIIGQLPEIHKQYTRMWNEKKMEHYYAMQQQAAARVSEDMQLQLAKNKPTIVDGMKWNVINPLTP